jgi:hypothetical protein
MAAVVCVCATVVWNCHQKKEQRDWLHPESERFRNEISSDCKEMESVRNVLEFSLAQTQASSTEARTQIQVDVGTVDNCSETTELSSESEQLTARIENQCCEIGKNRMLSASIRRSPERCSQGNGTSAASSLGAPVGTEFALVTQIYHRTPSVWTWIFETCVPIWMLVKGSWNTRPPSTPWNWTWKNPFDWRGPRNVFTKLLLNSSSKYRVYNLSKGPWFVWRDVSKSYRLNGSSVSQVYGPIRTGSSFKETDGSIAPSILTICH